MGYGLGFQTMDTMFAVVFLIFIVMFVISLAKGIEQWNKNNNSPKLDVEAVIVAKRKHVSNTHHANAGDITGAHGYHNSTSTTYYITFQVTSGDRIEVAVSGAEYGMLMEGDTENCNFRDPDIWVLNRNGN